MLTDVDTVSAGSVFAGVAPGTAGLDLETVEPPAFQPAGGTMATMLPHLGQAWICPIASGSRTFSRE